MSSDMLRDREARARIARDFDLNMLVEAGAGSGKTHSLAERMAAGIAAGAYVIDRMAAVTFTRKAAAELRGRFQVALETRLRGASGAEEARLRQALAHIERFFAGTIHAFCAQLLRERPVEAGVAPGFSELDEVQDLNRRRQSWRDYVTQAKSSGLPSMLAVLDAGLTPRDLDQAFDLVCMYEEVEFASVPAPVPDVRETWTAIDAFSADLKALLPPSIAPDTSCAVQQRARTFLGQLGVADRPRPSAAVDLLKTWDFKAKVVQYRWPGKIQSAQALALVEQFQRTTVRPFLSAWRAHVYSLAVTVLSDARRFAADDRRRANTLSYNDLLIGAATLLRTRPAVRRALQQKYRWLFVDEFQDTDPVQAEVMAWLAATDEAPASADADWTCVPLRPGALFVVGDPKQSIYRFRRADIDVYNQVRALVTGSGGVTLPLTSSFRSAPALCEWANRVFPALFPRETTPYAPAFTPLDAVRSAPSLPGGVATLTVPADVERARVADEEAARIARIIRAEVDAGRRGFGDFLVLTRKKRVLARYARALEALDIPLEVSGAGAFAESEAVAALALLLRALSDPDDAVTLVGVLRGPFFGVSDPALFAFRQAGGWFSLHAAQTSAEAGDALRRPAASRANAAQLDLFEDAAETDRPEARSPKPEAGRAAVLPESDVEGALRSLRALYRWTRRLPVGAAIERLLEDTGFLAMAVCTPGGAEAGDLLHAVDRIRQVAERGGTLADAADSLDEDIDATTEVESIPLEPGRPDVVRVMNLHKVKGLEAPVVFLADPCGGMASFADVRVLRQGGRGIGAFPITRAPEDKRWAKTLMGKPVDWDALAAEEVTYLDAEQDRLLRTSPRRVRGIG